MNKLLFVVGITLLSSCSHRIADLTMVSTRNVETEKKYVEKARYVKGRDVSLNDILLISLPSSPDIEDAVDNAIKKVDNGEFLKNVVIRERYYEFILFGIRSFYVRGDVWGLEK